jgi:tetratricopeptide (TPR) repeat protein
MTPLRERFPDSPLTALKLREAIRTDAPDRAIQELDRSLGYQQSNPELWSLKAGALKKAGRTDEALNAWQTAVTLHPHHAGLVASFVSVAREQKCADDELWALGQAVTITPEQEDLWTRMFALQMATGDVAAAFATTEKLLASKPEHEPYLLRRATCLTRMGRIAEADVLLSALVSESSPSVSAIDAWCRLLIEHMRCPQRVIDRLTSIATQSPENWRVQWWRGKALAVSHAEEALIVLERAAQLAPEQDRIWRDLAILQRHMGMADASQKSFERVLELNPHDAGAMRIAGYEHGYRYGDAAFRRVNVALARIHQFSKPNQVEIHYAAAKAFEDVGELDTAFEHYAVAGRIQKALTPWSDASMRRLIATFRRRLPSSTHQSLRATGFGSEKPVFVVGMPRSGSSLIEQIIASHPNARGVGETDAADEIVDGFRLGGTVIAVGHPGQPRHEGTSLAERGRRYLKKVESLAGSEPLRIVDKRLGNSTWVGLLDAALPGCRFIHTRRHPVNACLSAYRLFFGPEVPFSYDLRDLGRTYRAYHELMRYWSGLIPAERLLHIRYEEMLADPETHVRRVLSFIKLPWNDACMRYFENKRIVQTASSVQVRRPVYQTPIDAWRRYERYLVPLLDELGDLVADYEHELRHAACAPHSTPMCGGDHRIQPNAWNVYDDEPQCF